MQQIVIETPYQFVPPTRGRIWPAILARLATPYLRHYYGITSHEVRGAEKIRASIDAGCGIVCPGNHSRACEPMACGWLTIAARHPFFCMASWHTFMGSKFERFLIRRCGAYSIYREGTDHASLSFTVDAVASAERPIMIFAEGAVTRVNDRIAPLLDGTALIARMAARRAAKVEPARRVVIHPVAYKYIFQGDVETALPPVIERLEGMLSEYLVHGESFGQAGGTVERPPHNTGTVGRPVHNEALVASGGRKPPVPSALPSLAARVRRLEDALLAKFEIQYFGAPQRGPDGAPDPGDRAARLVDRIIEPLQAEWSPKESAGRGKFAMVQALRSRILPDIVAGKLSAEELARRRGQLADLYNAQILNSRPPRCLEGEIEPMRLIEAVHRIEEDLTDKVTYFAPTHLVIEAGDAIEVEPTRQRGEEDALTPLMHQRLTEMIERL